MHPLVAVQEAQHLAALPERNGFRRPREPHSLPTFPASRVDDRLLEWMERNRNLEHYPAFLELAARGEVGRRPIPKRLDDHLVIAGARQALENSVRLRVGHAIEVASDDHAGRIRT